MQGETMDTHNATIAFVTDDGTTICPHFGRAHYYEIITLGNGVVIHRERREKSGHHTFAASDHHEEHGQGRHGFDDVSRRKHEAMISPITDCQIVVTRGMGAGAYQHLAEAKITPIVTTLTHIDDAIREYVGGKLVNHTERLH
jgi:predicted Fe-Mo cluster-binding NifX family protein